MIKCTKCEIEKYEKEFAWRPKRNKFNSICRICVNEKRKETKNKNPEKYAETRRKWVSENRDHVNKLVLESQKRRKEKVNAYHREWYLDNRNKVIAQRSEQKERINKWQNNYYHNVKDPHKHRAHGLLNNYVAQGKIKKPESCMVCSEKKKLEAHHADYEKPLEVIWICRKCHVAIHKRLN